MESKKEELTLNEVFEDKKCLQLSIDREGGSFSKGDYDCNFQFELIGVKKFNSEVFFDYCTPFYKDNENNFLYVVRDSRKGKWTEMFYKPFDFNSPLKKVDNVEVEFAFVADEACALLWLSIFHKTGEISHIFTQYDKNELNVFWKDIIVYTGLISNKTYQ